ncbi:ThuA domain-containing protein [Fibrella sp. HMF5335]|uniref:ThuA domain-containing protein n=1 Tax=Fibrella rubiginis TaxID=2817060 RepID=A0A939GL99_9BACT|nr:ThuA domain-containing protein [Fibrella rubiginis]MBO0938895.1 ThuA domain-containing protein [Fibrella rubiginis]
MKTSRQTFLKVAAGLLVASQLSTPLIAQAKKPLVVFVTGDHEYSGELTLPLIAAELEKNYGIRTKVLKTVPDYNGEKDLPGLEALRDADLAVFFLRWRQLPQDQLDYIDAYLKSGKPVMGFRTTTHAFNYPAGDPRVRWNSFGEFAFGAPPGWGGKAQHTHYGHMSTTDVTVIPEAAKNPILTGVAPFHAASWLYRVLPDYPAKGAVPLLMGKSVNPDKAAIDNPVAWTWKNEWGGKTFLTTLGHPEDFRQESFQRLVINAIHTELGMPVPKTWKGKIDINVPYGHPK